MHEVIEKLSAHLVKFSAGRFRWVGDFHGILTFFVELKGADGIKHQYFFLLQFSQKQLPFRVQIGFAPVRTRQNLRFDQNVFFRLFL